MNYKCKHNTFLKTIHIFCGTICTLKWFLIEAGFIKINSGLNTVSKAINTNKTAVYLLHLFKKKRSYIVIAYESKCIVAVQELKLLACNSGFGK